MWIHNSSRFSINNTSYINLHSTCVPTSIFGASVGQFSRYLFPHVLAVLDRWISLWRGDTFILLWTSEKWISCFWLETVATRSTRIIFFRSGKAKNGPRKDWKVFQVKKSPSLQIQQYVFFWVVDLFLTKLPLMDSKSQHEVKYSKCGNISRWWFTFCDIWWCFTHCE